MQSLTRHELIFGSLGLAAYSFFAWLDFRLGNDVVSSISYVSILGFGLLARSRRLTVLLGLLGIVATIIGYYLSPVVIQDVDMTNRQLVVIAIMTITITSHIYMTRQQEFDARLYRIASTDELTSIANRRALMQTLENRISEAMRYNTSFSMLLFDLDNFKNINDEHGHLTGDDILIKITRVCARWLRTTDFMGRYGGEEFMVLCPNTSIDGAKALAERIRQAVEETEFTAHRKKFKITISVGVTELSNHIDSTCLKQNEIELSHDMIDAADSAMYNAKRNGKNRVVAYEPVIASQLKQSL
jgi:diguanylate cyclase (GGDEF)-like protein